MNSFLIKISKFDKLEPNSVSRLEKLLRDLFQPKSNYWVDMTHHLENDCPRLKLKLDGRKFWNFFFGFQNFWEEKTYFLPDREKSELEMNCIWQVWMTQKWWCHIPSNVPKIELESNGFILAEIHFRRLKIYHYHDRNEQESEESYFRLLLF